MLKRASAWVAVGPSVLGVCLACSAGSKSPSGPHGEGGSGNLNTGATAGSLINPGNGGSLINPGNGGAPSIDNPQTCAEATANSSYVGCDFWPTVVYNPVYSVFDFAVVVANAGNAPAQVSVTRNGMMAQVTVQPGSLEAIRLPWVPELNGAKPFDAQTQAAVLQGATLTVWPETAYPGYLQSSIGAANQPTAIIGSVEYDGGSRKNANALFLRNTRGKLIGSYRKRQLVPFGEFVPGRRWLPFLEALHVTVFDMQAGADTQRLLDGGPGVGKVGTVICFESSYPRLTQEQVARGAGLLVISTDDTWFGRTAAARQHSAMAAVRAAETDRYLVRSAATGISQVVDPTGRVLAEADLFRPAVVAAPVQSRTTRTFYVRWGDWFIGFCGLLLVGVSSVRVRRAGTSRSSAR